MHPSLHQSAPFTKPIRIFSTSMTTIFRPYQAATEQHEGQVGLSEVAPARQLAPQLCVCIRNYNGYIWFPIADISASNWMKYRDIIAKHLEQFKQLSQKDTKELTALRAKRHFLNESRAMIEEMFEHIVHMSAEDKRNFIKKYKNTYIGRHICEVCLTHSDKATYRCIHYDCGGMCKSCHEKLGEHCAVCDRPQKITCPICQEEKSIEELGSSESCFHKVCWECIGRAYKAHAPIDKCPQCRAVFTKPPPRPTIDEDDEALALELQELADSEIYDETESLPDLEPLQPAAPNLAPEEPPSEPAEQEPAPAIAMAYPVSRSLSQRIPIIPTHTRFDFPTSPVDGYPNPFGTPPSDRMVRIRQEIEDDIGLDGINVTVPDLLNNTVPDGMEIIN